MNDGWESPDEASCVKESQVYRRSGASAGKNTNWRSERQETQHDTSFDSSWGDFAAEVPETSNMNAKPFRGRGSSRGRGQNRDNSSFSRRQNFNGEPTIISVPTSMVGKVIGRGGSKIADLQETSDAKIVVTKDLDEEGKTIVKLFGTPSQTSMAKDLIEDLTLEKAPFRTNPTNIEAGAFRPPVQLNWKELSAECDRLTSERWKQTSQPMIKDFYQEHIEVKKMNEHDIRKFRRENNNIVAARVFAEELYEEDVVSQLPVDTKPIPKPVTTFEQAFHPWPEILEELKRAGFSKPSPIQAQAWPALLSGEDVIGIAQTGTGKTLAFLLPALIHIEHQPVPRDKRLGANVLVLAPTRELALQIEREVGKYSYKGISAVCLYGGGDRRQQVNIVTKGVEIIIATPGRLNDLVAAGHVRLDTITYLVLDEADRMLDMGFEPQIRKTLIDIRPDRQTTMTSATWPLGVRRLASSYMKDPLQIVVGSLDLAAVETVEQRIVMVADGDDDEEKMAWFMAWVRLLEPQDKVIVFCGKKSRADYISCELVSAGIECQALHGDREQSDREQAVKDISSGAVQILVATDVASRGLDIQDLTHVFNFDFPRHIEEYVHRVGRTGRAGRTGVAISLVTKMDWAQATDLVKILEDGGQFVPPELIQMGVRHNAWLEKKELTRYGGGGRGKFRVKPPL